MLSNVFMGDTELAIIKTRKQMLIDRQYTTGALEKILKSIRIRKFLMRKKEHLGLVFKG